MPRRAANTRRGLVSWPLYRLLLVIAMVPVLVAALATREPALPPTPPTPPTPFNGSAAATRAAYMLSLPKMRGPGGKGDLAAAGWISSQLERFGYRVSEQTFAADLPGQPNVPMKNVIGYLPGRLPDLIAVVAHHDGVGTGADDNASSVGVMLELARELRSTSPEHGLLFLSTDGGTTGGQGAAYFAEHSRLAGRVVSAIVLDSVAAPDGTPIRIVIRPDTTRGTSPTLFRTARSAIQRTTGRSPVVPGLLDQLSGLAVPYALGEQGPLLARSVPALSLTAGPPPDPHATFTSYSPAQLTDVGNATASLVQQLDGASVIEPGGRPDIFLGTRTMRGWLAETALVALLAPALACTLDMAARCRRRRLPLAPAVTALCWRVLPWAAFLVTLWLLPVLPGDLASGLNLAPRPHALGITWSGILLAALAGLAVWRFATRPRTVVIHNRVRRRAHQRPGGRPARVGLCVHAAGGVQPVRADPGAAGRARMAAAAHGGPRRAPLHGAGVPDRVPGPGAAAVRVCDTVPSRPLHPAGDAGDDRQRLPVTRDRGLPDPDGCLRGAGGGTDRRPVRTCASAASPV